MGLEEIINGKIESNKVMMFAKSFCPYCKEAKQVFEQYKLNVEDYEVWDIDGEEETKADKIQDILKNMTGARSVPRIFINGKRIGGADDLKALHSAGKLEKML